ncbi:uncharacterized protein LOC111793156 isoform X1 [Cucurbita pepo subsp. pepo]|uniref:uncharacterized protein LOC111793156 isoform X1 n=1 Tax=Cucurbita pepo subsp. pepo TaxID=3664 RepID=UPI000C9D5FD3|nr:uncharacterized protein LOC111793156 isoform X1 [Cucurbita pepo subsp. pepo]
MAIVTGDRYLEKLVKFVEEHADPLIEGTSVLKLNPAGLHYVQSRLEALHELESLLTGAPVDYLRAYVSDLGDHRALEQLRRILRLLTSLKVVSVLPQPLRDPTPLSLLPFGSLKVLELRGCDLSTSAARGLLELRQTLEKIICHNSTDALRHVFASRIVEVKNSAQWSRLSFVSCACNGLVLMDESLQLLPAVETLDLSRNKFAKVDNLRKCVKLKHLDLGFNHLRTVASFTEVPSNLIKLVLRNNALTTLRGIENLKSLEGLDVSYNIISNFSELEFLVDITSLQNLWLEGNPLCCARWYRAHVFSLFSYPDNLKLDDKGICKREYWKRKIIIASRQKRPASFGFYSPAKDGAQGEGSINRKKKTISRIASIQSEEESTYFCSDQESVCCDNETESRGEAALSDNEVEAVDLMKKIEFIKKERSALWLREFEDWMDRAPPNTVNGNINRAILHPGKENYLKSRKTSHHVGESSRYKSESIQASGDESSTNFVESDSSFVEPSGLTTSHYFGLNGTLGNDVEVPLSRTQRLDHKSSHLSSSFEGIDSPSTHVKSFHPSYNGFQGGQAKVEDGSMSPLYAIDSISESHSSSAFPSSPPHYQEDILHRRHNFMEEILQLSAESYSVPSSDSYSSSSEDDIFPFEPLMQEVIQPTEDNSIRGSAEGQLSLDHSKGGTSKQCHEHLVGENGLCHFDSSVDQISSMQKSVLQGSSMQLPCNVFPADAHAYGTDHSIQYENSKLRNRESKRKVKKRVVSLSGHTVVGMTDKHKRTSCDWSVSGADMEIELENDKFIENYFNLNIADSGVHETCRQYLKCICILDSEHVYRKVVLLLSSRNKLYVLIVRAAGDGSGAILILSDCHNVEDIKEVFVGLGLQVVRVCMERSIKYLFVTRCIEKSRQLLCMLQVSDIGTPSDKSFLRSLEQVQVELFEKQICGGAKANLLQYSMVLFCCSEIQGELWRPRSLFIFEGHLVVCIEDLMQLMQFDSFSMEGPLPPYYALDSCCLISDILEMVVDVKGALCVTLSLKFASSEFSLVPKSDEEVTAIKKETSSLCSTKWKIKWFHEENLLNFIALAKAIHLGSKESPLPVRYLS